MISTDVSDNLIWKRFSLAAWWLNRIEWYQRFRIHFSVKLYYCCAWVYVKPSKNSSVCPLPDIWVTSFHQFLKKNLHCWEFFRGLMSDGIPSVCKSSASFLASFPNIFFFWEPPTRITHISLLQLHARLEISKESEKENSIKSFPSLHRSNPILTKDKNCRRCTIMGPLIR